MEDHPVFPKYVCKNLLFFTTGFWWGPCCSYLQFSQLFYYVSLHTQFRVVISTMISTRKLMFRSSPIFCGRAHIIYILFVFVAYSGLQHAPESTRYIWWGPCCSSFQFVVLSYYVSLRHQLRVVMSVTIAALKKCSVRLNLQSSVGVLMSCRVFVYICAYIDIQYFAVALLFSFL